MNSKPIRVRISGPGVQEALHEQEHVNSNTYMSKFSKSRLQVPDVSSLRFSIRGCVAQEGKKVSNCPRSIESQVRKGSGGGGGGVAARTALSCCKHIFSSQSPGE